MNAIVIVAIVAAVLVLVLLVMRRDRPRRIGGGDGPAPAPAPPQPREGGPSVEQDPALSNLSEVDRAEIEQLIASGRKISAIKLVRERTGMGLKEAKEFVEDFTSGGGG